MTIDGPSVAISVSPHPDDELLGAPATLMALRDAGWRVVNFACSLGRAADRERRRAELAAACELAGFELVVADPLAEIGAGDDLEFAQRALAGALVELLERFESRLMVGPSPHDGHHGHEVTGRAICDAVESRGQPLEVMFWGLWGELPFPNVLTGFDADRLAEIERALAAHAGEIERNRFDRLLAGRSQANAVLGAERVFGFGASGRPDEYAELLTHVCWSGDRGWRLAHARDFDAAHVANAAHVADAAHVAGAPPAEGPEIGWWLRAPSAAARLRSAR